MIKEKPYQPTGRKALLKDVRFGSPATPKPVTMFIKVPAMLWWTMTPRMSWSMPANILKTQIRKTLVMMLITSVGQVRAVLHQERWPVVILKIKLNQARVQQLKADLLYRRQRWWMMFQ